MTKIRGRVKELWLDFLYDIAGGFLQAVALHCFIDSIDIAPGGATGLAILLNRFTSLPIGILTFAVNVPLLIAAWIYLGKGRTIKTLKTVAVLTVILDFIITPYVPVYTGDKMVSCIFGGVLMGASLAMVFMRGSTTGGGDIAAKLLQKYRPHMQTGTAVMLTDMVIIGASMVVFGNIESGLYGLINMVVSTYVIDIMLYGMNKSTMVTVMSPKVQEIGDQLMEHLGRGCTFFKSRGGYAKVEGETLICVVDRKQFYKAKKDIYGIERGCVCDRFRGQRGVWRRLSGFRLGSIKVWKKRKTADGQDFYTRTARFYIRYFYLKPTGYRGLRLRRWQPDPWRPTAHRSCRRQPRSFLTPLRRLGSGPPGSFRPPGPWSLRPGARFRLHRGQRPEAASCPPFSHRRGSRWHQSGGFRRRRDIRRYGSGEGLRRGSRGFPYCMDAGGKESLGVADAHLADAGSDAAYGRFK